MKKQIDNQISRKLWGQLSEQLRGQLSRQLERQLSWQLERQLSEAKLPPQDTLDKLWEKLNKNLTTQTNHATVNCD